MNLYKNKYQVNLTWIVHENAAIYLSQLQHYCLNTMKKIDNFSEKQWHYYRKITNPFDFPSRSLAVNRAFYKLWEILAIYSEIQLQIPVHGNGNTVKVLLLAEAPGSFVQVIKKKWPDCHCVAVTKPIDSYAEVVKNGTSSPRFSNTVLELPNCTFLYNNLTNYYNVNQFVDKYKDSFDLITADGGFDEKELYSQKETLHYDLILSEIVCILNCQTLHGNCILKVFETFTTTSFFLLWLLCHHYKSYHFVKPSTSRPTNSEKYIVCVDFQGLNYSKDELIDLTKSHVTSNMTLNLEVPDIFINSLLNVVHVNTIKQIDYINQVVHTLESKDTLNKRKLYQDKKNTFFQWKQTFNYYE